MSLLIPDQIIKGVDLRNAMDLLNVTPKPRFGGATFRNESTKYAMLLTLYQGHDESEQELPPGYVLNTGVVVGATYIAPGAQQVSSVQAQINCLTTRVEANCRWRYLATGYEDILTFRDVHAPAGVRYLMRVTFRITDSGIRRAFGGNRRSGYLDRSHLRCVT